MKYGRVRIDSIGYELAPVVVTSAEIEDRLASLLREAHIPFLLLRQPMEAATPEGLSSLSKDGIHPTQAGHRVAADAIAPYVLSLMER